MKFIFNNITRLALRFRAVTIVLVVLLLTLGAFSWTRLNQELLPPIDVPQTIILAQTSGMTGDQVLEIVTKPLESRLSEIDEIINVTSETQATFGAFITAFNDFGQDQEAVQASIREAINDVWLPRRELRVDDVTPYFADLDAAVLIYLAENDSNFLFQLAPEVWDALSNETIAQVLAYLAQTQEEAQSSANALQRLVDKEVVPQIDAIPEVVNIDVAGGQQLPSETEAASEEETEQTQESLLLRLSPDVWNIVSVRVDGISERDQSAVDALSTVSVDIPNIAIDAPPALPERWQVAEGDDTPTFFFNASDLIEIGTVTQSVAGNLNDFFENGEIIGSLGMTNDLTVDDVQRMMALDSSMVGYFNADHVLALPDDVFAYLVEQPEFLNNLDAFTRDSVATRLVAPEVGGENGETVNRVPVELPGQWRIQPPQLITFSFSDIPLGTFSVFVTGEIDIEEDTTTAEANEEEGDETEPAQPAMEDTDDGPALNPQWALVANLLSEQAGVAITLDTADDLLNLPFAFSDLANQLLNNEQAAFLADGLLGNIPLDAAEYLMEQDPALLSSLPADARDLLSDDVAAIVDATLPDVWNTLLSQTPGTRSNATNGYTVSELLALDEAGLPSNVLNRIATAQLNDDFDSYVVRLMDSLTVDVVNAFIDVEPDFFQNLEADVLLDFSAETLNLLSADEVEALPNLSVEQAEHVITIQNDPTASAFAELANLYISDVPAADPNAPAIDPGWRQLGDFYNIELDSADDFFRLPDDFPFPNGAELVNSLFGNPQGEAFAPQLLGSIDTATVNYILNREEPFFSELNNRALGLLSDNIVALLPDDVQEFASDAAPDFEPDNQITRTNDQPSLFVTVFKDAEANTVTTYGEVEELLNQIDEENENIEIGVVFEQSSFVEESISGVAREGTLGAIFAIIIILIFLSGGSWARGGRSITGTIMIALFGGILVLLTLSQTGDGVSFGDAFAQLDVVVRVLLIFGVLAGAFVLLWPGNVPNPAWRATLVIAVSIPLSIMIALSGMNYLSPAMNGLIAPLAQDSAFFEFVLRIFPEQLTLNIMTLSGLTVAVGRVVDDSIVVLENIFRQLQAGGDKKEAILQGTRDVSAAIFTATLIAVTVFLPLGLTGGLIGAFFLPFGLAVTYALAGSFMVAITVIPVLAYLFTSIEDMPEDGDIWVANFYRPLLKWGLRGPAQKIFIIVLAIVSFMFAGFLFSQRPFAFLPSFGEPQVTVNVSLPSGTSILTTNELVSELETWVNDTYGDQVSTIQTNVGGGGANFETLLTGGGVSENLASLTIGLTVGQDTLEGIGKAIELEAKRIFNTCSSSSAAPNTEEQRALLTTGELEGATDIVCSDGSTINNNVTVAAASVADGGFGGFELVVSGPITAAVNQQIIDTINSVEGLARSDSNFIGDAGGDESTVFIRVNQAEAFSYSAEVNTENTIGVTQEAILEIQAIPAIADSLCAVDATDTSGCFSVSQGFESEIQTEGFASLGIAMVLSIGIVVIILATTMQSFVYWLAIVFSIIVAPVGAAIALTLADRVLGISALIGLLMLIGLVIANGVVLIDRVRSNRRERGMNLHDALVEAGGRRLRPILMTSLATIIALTPLAIGLSEGAIIASELGTVVIGGSISSTLLTLIVVPIVFSVLSPLHRLLSIRKDAETRDVEAAD